MSPYHRAPSTKTKCPSCGAVRTTGGNTRPGQPCANCKTMHKHRVPNAPCLVALARIERWAMHDRLTRRR